eukprot:20719_1
MMNILQQSTQCIHFYIFILGVSLILLSSRATVWLAYAETFADYSVEAGSWIIYIDTILNSLVGFCMCYFGDRVGFDKMIVIQLFIVSTGCFIEAFATNFKVLCLGYLLSQNTLNICMMAFASWLLPNKHAKMAMSLTQLVFVVAYLFGPVSAGILFELFDQYRATFVVNAFMMTIAFVIAFFFYTTQMSQSKLVLVQIESSLAAEMQNTIGDDPDELFPSFIKHTKEETSSTNSNASWNSFFATYSTVEWCKKSILLLERAMVASFEPILITYYLVFMSKRYNVDNITMFCTLQMVVLSVTSGLFGFITPKTYRFVGSHTLFILSCVILAGCCGLFGLHLPFHVYWIVMAIIGASYGSLVIIVEHNLLDAFLPEHAAKVNGIKSLMKGIFNSFGLLLSGLYEAWFLVVICECVICIILYCIYAILGNEKLYVDLQQSESNSMDEL